jgi:hypothetical protein
MIGHYGCGPWRCFETVSIALASPRSCCSRLSRYAFCLSNHYGMISTNFNKNRTEKTYLIGLIESWARNRLADAGKEATPLVRNLRLSMFDLIYVFSKTPVGRICRKHQHQGQNYHSPKTASGQGPSQAPDGLRFSVCIFPVPNAVVARIGRQSGRTDSYPGQVGQPHLGYCSITFHKAKGSRNNVSVPRKLIFGTMGRWSS